MTRIVAAFGIVLLLTVSACERSTSTTSHVDVTKANCIVCGDHELDVTSDTFFSDHKGSKYYFCSKECKSDFDKDPQRYLAKAKPPAGTTAPAVQ